MDEVDRLFEMGFTEQVDDILSACPHTQIQHSMFSATMYQGVETLARTVLKSEPIRILVGSRNASTDLIKQKLLFVGKEDGKLLAFRQLIQQGLSIPMLIFVQSKERAVQLHRELAFDGINVDLIHAERTQAQRDDVIRKFRVGRVWVLICTDLMARGIDFKCVKCVLNYDFPQSTVSYVHRIGRTGRAGRPGEAITFFTDDDTVLLRNIAGVMKASGCDVPAWMLAMKSPSQAVAKKIKASAPPRSSISKKDKQKSRSGGTQNLRRCDLTLLQRTSFI